MLPFVRVPRFAARLVVSTLVCSMALGIVACSGKPENSPVIRKKFAEMDAVQAEVAEATKTLKAIAGDMTMLKDQMSDIRALSPDPTGTIQAVKRLEELERRLANLDGAAVSSAAMAAAPITTTEAPAAAPTTPAAGTETAAATAVVADPNTALVAKAAEVDAPRLSSADSLKTMTNPTVKEAAKAEPKPAAKEATKVEAKPATVQASAKKPADAKAAVAPKPATKTATAPRGKYHKVVAGDTLEKIAKSNNTSVDSIRSANKLPAGARPLLGQQLFIPQS